MSKEVRELVESAKLDIMQEEETRGELLFKGDSAGLLLTDRRLIYVAKSQRTTTIVSGLLKDVSSVVRFSLVPPDLSYIVVGALFCAAALGIIGYGVWDSIGIFLGGILGLAGVTMIVCYFFTGKQQIVVDIGGEKTKGTVSGLDPKVPEFMNKFYAVMLGASQQ